MRSGRPSSACTDANIVKMRKFVDEGERISYYSIQYNLFNWFDGSQLNFARILGCASARFLLVPWTFIERKKKNLPMEWCQKMRAHYQNGTSKQIFGIVAGNESWIYQFDPEVETQSTRRVFSKEESPTKIERARSVEKQLWELSWGHNQFGRSQNSKEWVVHYPMYASSI